MSYKELMAIAIVAVALVCMAFIAGSCTKYQSEQSAKKFEICINMSESPLECKATLY